MLSLGRVPNEPLVVVMLKVPQGRQFFHMEGVVPSTFVQNAKFEDAIPLHSSKTIGDVEAKKIGLFGGFYRKNFAVTFVATQWSCVIENHTSLLVVLVVVLLVLVVLCCCSFCFSCSCC